MPLSEQEQRLLDEMERQLLHSDADVVGAPGSGRGLSYRRIVYGTVLVLLGLGGLVAGVALPMIVVGVIGFVVMLGGVVLAVTPNGRRQPSTGDDKSAKSTTRKSSPGFMDRMNERWDRRQDGQQ
ncbi:hypothetical protein LK09_13930 [Microbacterium mangrovi]|uniref:DUF3040 domain-containing protein n=1 Tax=Microbacterium mangrovi TaxID=1348253 RepID=A0A0B2A5U8_9MICO|nr:DUF3040 domain-containing protein [Microbacterium mangrovi]KHK96933.1 hypothetical protein LK09_13930 [Microbacterium mangrovi]